MNTKRVLLGGLAAGVLLNIGEGTLNAGILMDDYTALMESTGLVEADWAMAGYIGSTFILGFAVAWLYAALRPRFGPGWSTGVQAGAFMWVVAYLVPSIWFAAMGMGLGPGSLDHLTLEAWRTGGEKVFSLRGSYRSLALGSQHGTL